MQQTLTEELPARAVAPQTVGGQGSRRVRIESIDVVRGLIILIMALDHVRDFFGDVAARPTDLSTTTAALFFTRWITNICAPVFFLLAGTSAYLTLQRMSKRQLAGYLVSRGLWLILLELVVMRFALQFNVDYHVTVITVLWALGWAMIGLAGLIWLPNWGIALFGIVLVFGHNALDGIAPKLFGGLAPLWSVLHQPGIILKTGESVVVVTYVLIPWIGVTALGYVLGAVYDWHAARRQTLLLRLGVGVVGGFIALRLLNVYGDPAPWSPQSGTLWTTMSFLNTVKYPPSLLFLLMTLGPALLLLRLFDNRVPPFLRPALVVGKVPLFFYVLHFFLIHLLAVAASYLRYGEVGAIFRSPDLGHFPFSQPPGWPSSLMTIYLLWLLVVLIMLPLCYGYAQLRRSRTDWWLSYL
jgi:uncharacterized membrane protein